MKPGRTWLYALAMGSFCLGFFAGIAGVIGLVIARAVGRPLG